jgi:pilus assembly protein FimV
LFNVKTLSIAVASALMFSNASAAGLGKLTVLSALGQPLRAEIELTSVSKDEAGALAAKLASVEAFRQANVEYNSALSSLRFAIEQRGEQQIIRVTSTQAVNEPFIDMLLELSGPNGRLVREYTFLLDPPDLRTSQTAQVGPTTVPGVGAVRGQIARRAEAGQSVAEPGRSAPRAQAARAEGANAGEYRVKSGDTLAGIANQYRQSAVSLDQMLVALYRANPDAFIDKNINRLKAGQILSVPSVDAAAAIGKQEAHSIVLTQAADFNSYRSKLASQVAAGAARKSAEAGQSASGKITAKVEEKSSPASEAKDKLKLSSAAAAGAADKSAAGSPEDRIAREKELAEADARIKELEKNVSDLQKILEMKNQSLAEQQGKAEQKPAEVVAAQSPKAEQPHADPAADKPAATDAAPAVSAPAKPATPAAAKPKPVVQPAPKPEPGLLDDLADNPWLPPALGALLVGLGVLGVYGIRRRKQSKQFEDSIITDSSLKANSLFGSTGGQSVDTNNSVFNSSFAPSASQLDTNEVDPVAEADVYIAYGRDAQAEEILKEALRTQPDRHAVRVKLLEIYSNRKDLRAFELVATELYGLTKGSGEEWMQAAKMGVEIDPNNPLYADGKADEPKHTGTLAAPTQPLEEQGLATLLSESQSEPMPGNVLETNTSYFSSTTLNGDTVRPTTQSEPEADAEPAKPSSNELDFDLDGMMQGIEVPNTIPRPTPAEPSADLAAIDFDFLDTASTPPAAEQPVVEAPADPAAEVEMPTLEFASTQESAQPAVAEESSIDFELPALEETESDSTAAKAKADDSMDFDLSAISLDLNPVPSAGPAETAVPELDLPKQDEAPAGAGSPVDVEMATKLDLALAYQEIGDKEGARELLDEVLKGGSAEQSERAKALLLELA